MAYNTIFRGLKLRRSQVWNKIVYYNQNKQIRAIKFKLTGRAVLSVEQWGQ